MYKQGKAIIVSGQTFTSWGAGGGLTQGKVFFPGSGILQIRARGYPIDVNYSANLVQFILNLQVEMNDDTWDHRASADLTTANNWQTLIAHPIDMSLNLPSFLYSNYDWELSPGNIAAKLDPFQNIKLIPDLGIAKDPGVTILPPYIIRPPRYRVWMDAFPPITTDISKLRGAWHAIYA